MRAICAYLIIISVLSVSTTALAWDADAVSKFGPPTSQNRERALAAAPCISATSRYTIGDLWFPQIYTVGLCLYTGYYPGSSNNMQIFQTGPWMGGYAEDGGGEPWTAIGTFDQLDFLMYDSICSGFNVSEPGQSSVDVESTFDTAYSPRDLGVVVTLRYMMWDDPRLDDCIVIKAGIKFRKAIEDFWFGWMSDCDIGNNDLPDYYYDDLVGYDETRGVAYMYDDDGDPAIATDAKSKLLSSAHVGQVLLSAPPPGGSIHVPPATNVSWETFAWWDWNNDVTGDAAAYERMCRGTISPYPPEVPFDYRMMTAVGPYDVEAGDSATFYIALVFGEGLDAEYWARRSKIGGEVSDMGSLIEHVENIKDFFASGLVLADPAPHPPILEDPRLNGRKATLSWESVSEEDDDFAGYRVYRSLVSNVGPWDLLADFAGRPFVHTYEDTLRIGFPTFYLVTAYDLGGNESNKGSAVTKTLGGIYATTVPSDYEGDCESLCEDQCQDCQECYDQCLEKCMQAKRAAALDKILVAPNPYRGSADWERLDYEGRIAFYNLPRRCTIYIYTITGELVDVVYHNMPGDDTPDPEESETGGERWDMITSNGQSIASGIYIYRVTSPEYGEKIGKFAVIRGER